MGDFTGRWHERRNSINKHGGIARVHPNAPQPPKELSDDELLALENDSGELSDDDLLAMENGQAPTSKPLSREDRNAGYALHALDLPLFGYGPEVAAAASTILPGGKSYGEELSRAEDIKKRYNEQVPFTDPLNLATGVAGLAGGAAPAKVIYDVASLGSKAARGALGFAPKAVSTLGKIVQGGTDLAATGALGGGVYESSNAPGTVTEKLMSVRPSAIGAATGPIAGLAGLGGVKLAQTARNAFRPYEEQAARYLAERLGTATPEELAAAHAQAAQTGKPVVLADVGPKGVRDTAGVVAREPGEGREIAQKVLNERQQGQVQRVGGDVGQATGGKPGSFTKTDEALAAQQQAEARPLYERALGGNKPVVSPKIVEITNRPSGKSAMQRGLKIAQDEGIPESELVIKDANGNVTGYSAKALHYMKMGLDDMIESAQRTGDNSAARAFSIMKNELLGEMDAQIPGYAQARQSFAGHAANRRALEQGRNAVNSHPDQIASEMRGMTAGEQEMYRRGFAQRVIETVEASPDKGNAVNRIFGNTAKRARLKQVLGEAEFKRLEQRLGVEAQMYETYATANVGSATAERQAQSADLEASALGEYGPALAEVGLTGNVSSLLHRIGMGGIANMLRRINAGRREALARMLFSNDHVKVKAAVAAIKAEYAGVQAAKGAAATGSALTATQLGSQAAGQLGP